MHLNQMHALEETQDSSGQTTILIADDFPECRVRVREILSDKPEWQIVGEACDGVEVVRKAIELRPDLVLLDIGMPGMNGFEVAVKIRETVSASKVVFLTQPDDPDLRSAALAMGAEGYVSKSNAPTELLSAISTALRNGRRKVTD